MSDTNQEPTMEEILASIRRIISEDDAPQGEAQQGEDAVAAVAEEEAPQGAEDEVLDLTERVEEPPVLESPTSAETVGDLDVYEREEEPAAFTPEPQYQPEPEPAPRAREPEPAPARETWSAREDEGLVSSAAAGAAASAFSQLSQSLLMPREGRSLEDVVQELLKPMLKDWLDQNLPAIVQAKVDEEVERIARGRVR